MKTFEFTIKDCTIDCLMVLSAGLKLFMDKVQEVNKYGNRDDIVEWISEIDLQIENVIMKREIKNLTDVI